MDESEKQGASGKYIYIYIYSITECILTLFLSLFQLYLALHVPISQMECSIHSHTNRPPAEWCLDYKLYSHEWEAVAAVRCKLQCTDRLWARREGQLGNQQRHYGGAHKNPPLDPVLNKMNSPHLPLFLSILSFHLRGSLPDNLFT